MRKPAFCICKNKDADQLCGNRKADQRLCFRYTDSTIPPLYKSEISSLWPFSVAVQPGLCQTRSETRMLVFSQRGSNVNQIWKVDKLISLSGNKGQILTVLHKIIGWGYKL